MWIKSILYLAAISANCSRCSLLIPGGHRDGIPYRFGLMLSEMSGKGVTFSIVFSGLRLEVTLLPEL